MKMTKKLLAAVLALSLAACTAMGTFSVSAAEAPSGSEGVSATELAMPNFNVVTDFDVLDGDIATVPEEVMLVWLEQNFDYAKSLPDAQGEEPYLDIVYGKNEDGTLNVCYVNILNYDSYDELIEAYENNPPSPYSMSKESLADYVDRFGDAVIYVAAPVDLLDCDVSVDMNEQSVIVTFNGNEIPASEYTVTYFGVDNDYESWEFPAEPGEYSVTVAAKDGSFYVKDGNDNATFTIEAEEESSESTVESESESTVESEESSETESIADTSSAADSSKADTSSKATSTASSTNPATGAAAAMGILAVAAAGIAVSKKKSK